MYEEVRDKYCNMHCGIHTYSELLMVLQDQPVFAVLSVQSLGNLRGHQAPRDQAMLYTACEIYASLLGTGKLFKKEKHENLNNADTHFNSEVMQFSDK